MKPTKNVHYNAMMREWEAKRLKRMERALATGLILVAICCGLTLLVAAVGIAFEVL